MTIVKALRIFALSVLVIYGGGVIFSHLEYSADDRAACHSAGGFVGRIWCPDSVETEGFQFYFVKALGWPVHVARAQLATAEIPDDAVAAFKQAGAAEALRKLQPLAEQGDTSAQFKLGAMYREGLGGRQDYTEAAKWFRLAAERGETKAQSSLSFAYEKGQGVRQNYVEAYKWARLAAAQGAERARADRDSLATKMSSAELAEAERRARAWNPKAKDAQIPDLREAEAREAVNEAQRLLNALGYGIGVADGVAGPQTRAAINDFQLRDGMQISGEVSDELLVRLKNSVRAR